MHEVEGNLPRCLIPHYLYCPIVYNQRVRLVDDVDDRRLPEQRAKPKHHRAQLEMHA